MKPAALIAVVGALACGLTGPQASANMISNPSFEDGLADGIPKGWEVPGKGKKKRKWKVEEATEAHEGSKSLKLSEGHGRIRLPIKVEPGKIYTLSYWVKGDGLSRGSRVSMSYKLNKPNGFDGGSVFPVRGPMAGWNYQYRYIRTRKHHTGSGHIALKWAISRRDKGKAAYMIDDLKLVEGKVDPPAMADQAITKQFCAMAAQSCKAIAESGADKKACNKERTACSKKARANNKASRKGKRRASRSRKKHKS